MQLHSEIACEILASCYKLECFHLVGSRVAEESDECAHDVEQVVFVNCFLVEQEVEQVACLAEPFVVAEKK